MSVAPLHRRVIFVRHGHYDRIDDLGDTAWELSALGRRQAYRAARRLAAVIAASGGRFDGIYTSPWPRAAQTAEIAARELSLPSVRVKPYLREAIALFSGGIDPSDPDDPVARLAPSPEDLAELREATLAQVIRVEQRFLRVPKRLSLVAVFTHGNLMRYLTCRQLHLPLSAWMHMEIHHTAFTEFRVYENGAITLASYNDTGHLPPAMVTSV